MYYVRIISPSLKKPNTDMLNLIIMTDHNSNKKMILS